MAPVWMVAEEVYWRTLSNIDCDERLGMHRDTILRIEREVFHRRKFIGL